jgi:hypothetical protein
VRKNFKEESKKLTPRKNAMSEGGMDSILLPPCVVEMGVEVAALQREA